MKDKLKNELLHKMPHLSDNDVVHISHYLQASYNSGYSAGLEIGLFRRGVSFPSPTKDSPSNASENINPASEMSGHSAL